MCDSAVAWGDALALALFSAPQAAWFRVITSRRGENSNLVVILTDFLRRQAVQIRKIISGTARR
jgi:hypothetical protein